jgi:hypothetical protein
MGYWALFSGNLSGFDAVLFTRLMKLPGLLGELGSAYLVHRVWSVRAPSEAARAFAVYGTSLPLILVSGYHCNTECLYGALALLAVWLMEDKKFPGWSGVALAGALNVKLLPVFLGPALLARTRTRRDALVFCAGSALAIVPYAPFLLSSGQGMYRNMVEYNSLQLDWGLMAFLNAAVGAPQFATFASDLRQFVVDTGRYWLLGAIVAVSTLDFIRRRLDGYTLGALAWALFLVLTPGFGVQYAVSVLPLLACVDLRASVRYGLSAGAMLFLIYTHRMVWQVPLAALVQYFPMPQLAVYAGLLAWCVLAAFVTQGVLRLTRTA